MTGRNRLVTAMTVGLKEHLRNVALLALMVVLPFLFITVSIAATPMSKLPVYTVVDGVDVSLVQTMPEVHGVVMTPITGAFISGLTGLFVMHSAKTADGRLVLVGYRPSEVILSRFATLGFTALVVTAVATGVMYLDFQPKVAWWFVLGMLLVSVIYGFIGMLVGVVLDDTAGMYVMLFAPLMDIGVFQDPMFVRGPPEWWMQVLPGHFPLRMMLDAGFTPTVDTVGSLVVSLSYLGVVVAATVAVFARQTRLR